MGNSDQSLAQSIYLANMFAQRKTCDCTACKLLRRSTDVMINQALAPANTEGQQLDQDALVKAAEALASAGMGGK